jgi:hypothetical protein
VDNAGNMELTHDSADARVKVAVNVKMFRLAQLPKIFMFGNYPNPFKRTTSFKFAVPLAAPSLDENSKRKVSIKIYSIQGRLIRTLVEGPVKVGYHTAIFDGKGDKHQNLGIGAYLARMEADGFTKTIKLILAR